MYLNTSYVNLQLSEACTNQESGFNLNTSYVNLQPGYGKQIDEIEANLNTSYVNLQQLHFGGGVMAKL